MASNPPGTPGPQESTHHLRVPGPLKSAGEPRTRDVRSAITQEYTSQLGPSGGPSELWEDFKFKFRFWGRFPAKIGPKTPLNGSGSKNGVFALARRTCSLQAAIWTVDTSTTSVDV